MAVMPEKAKQRLFSVRSNAELGATNYRTSGIDKVLPHQQGAYKKIYNCAEDDKQIAEVQRGHLLSYAEAVSDLMVEASTVAKGYNTITVIIWTGYILDHAMDKIVIKFNEDYTQQFWSTMDIDQHIDAERQKRVNAFGWNSTQRHRFETSDVTFYRNNPTDYPYTNRLLDTFEALKFPPSSYQVLRTAKAVRNAEAHRPVKSGDFLEVANRYSDIQELSPGARSKLLGIAQLAKEWHEEVGK